MKEIIADKQKYSQFWNMNLQEIENIKQSLTISINNLEKKQPDYERLFDEILANVNTLSAVYSNFNTLKGSDYILKLKALMSDYRKNVIKEGIDFNLVYFLIDKISEQTYDSFKNFPQTQHDTDDISCIERLNPSALKEVPYKWFTFEKNGFWFILKYNKLRIIRKDSGVSEKNLGNGSLEITDGEEKFICRNLFPKLTSDETKNNYYIIPDSNRINFSATGTGRRIYAAKDIISSRIEKYSRNFSTEISPGRVKLFGKKHIVLN